MANDVVPSAGGVPALFDYSMDQGRGFENQAADELQIPFVALLQDLSPQVTGEGDAAVAGAKAGKFFNSVSGAVLDPGFTFIPAHKERVFVEWKARSQGGGLVNRYLPDDPVVLQARAESKEFGQYVSKAGNKIVDTIYLFGILGDGTPACLMFASSKMKVYKKWNSQVNAMRIGGVQPPRWAHLTVVSAIRDKNKAGQPYWNIVLSPAVDKSFVKSLLAPSDDRYIAAKALADMAASGKAKVAEENVAATPDETDEPF